MTEEKLSYLPWSQLVPAPYNPRGEIKDADVAELRGSIQKHGMLEPLLVRPLPIKGRVPKYEVVCGNRRLRACIGLQIQRVQCVVREMSDDAALLANLAENIEREDIHPIDEATLLKSIGEGITQEEVGGIIGRDASYVSRRLYLLRLCDAARDRYRNGDFSTGGALEIAAFDADLQTKIVNQLKRAQGAPPLSLNSVRHVCANYLLALRDAPWGLKDAALSPDAGACSLCPKVSSRQPRLFKGTGVDTCSDPACWAEKNKRWLKLRKDALKEKGARILTKAETVDLFKSRYHGLGRAYADVDAVADFAHGHPLYGKTHAQLLGDDKHKALMVCVDPKGKLRLVVKKSDVLKVARATGKLKGSSRKPAGAPSLTEVRTERKVERALLAGELAAIHIAVMGKTTATLYTSDHFRAVAMHLIHNALSDTQHELAIALDLVDPKMDDAGVLLRYVKGEQNARALNGFVMQFLFAQEYRGRSHGTTPVTKHLRNVLEIPTAKLRAAAKRDVAPKKTTKKKTARKKKARQVDTGA